MVTNNTMEDKLAAPASAVGLESEAATIAATSVAEDEKISTAGEPSDTDAPRGTTPADAEKKDDLTRQATAVSKTGQSITQTQTREDGTEYPTGMKLGLITLALCLSVFLMALGMLSSGHGGLVVSSTR